jgi:hypothetical protein
MPEQEENNIYGKYNLKVLHDYFFHNGISNGGVGIKIEWTSDTKYNIDMKIIDYDKIIWEYKDKIIRRTEMVFLLNEIERILKLEYHIEHPIKSIITVSNVLEKDELNNTTKIQSNKKGRYDELMDKHKKAEHKKKEIKIGGDKKDISRVAKIKRYTTSKVYASMSKDSDVFNEKEKEMFFREIVGFRIHNKDKNVSICLDYWKDDEKIVLRLANKETGKVSKILFQKSVLEILDEIQEAENNSGIN